MGRTWRHPPSACDHGPPTTDDHHHPRTTHQRQGIELDKGVPIRLTKALIDSLSVRTVGKQPKSASGSALEGADGAASMDDSQGYTRADGNVCAICLGKIRTSSCKIEIRTFKIKIKIKIQQPRSI